MGLTTGKTGTTTYSQDRIAHAAKMRNSGKTIEEIAAYFNVTERTVWRWVNTDIWRQFCDVVETRNKPSRTVDPDEVHKAYLLYEHLGNIPKVAHQMDRAYATIKRWMKSPHWK